MTSSLPPIKWNREQIIQLLDAEIEDPDLDDTFAADHGIRDYGVHFVRFADRLMKYELWIVERSRSVMISSDPERAPQALPSFEISLPCAELAPLKRGGMPTGLGIYADTPSPSTLRFSITRRKDGIISLSGCYAGLLRKPHFETDES